MITRRKLRGKRVPAIVLGTAAICVACYLQSGVYEIMPGSLAWGGTLPLATTNQAPPPEPSEAEEITARLHEKGLQEVKRPEVEHLFHDKRYQDGRVILVDARDEENYLEGHIPGAHELNPYHPEKELSNVLPLCQKAEKVVVYCTGGDCEDSDSTAILLRDGGIPNEKLFVYGGGFTEWETNHLPIKKGSAK